MFGLVIRIGADGPGRALVSWAPTKSGGTRAAGHPGRSSLTMHDRARPSPAYLRHNHRRSACCKSQGFTVNQHTILVGGLAFRPFERVRLPSMQEKA
jgi:hypothetical protein